MKLGDCVVNLWGTRSWCIRSDFAVTGWLLFPIKEVHDDMRSTVKERHIECATRVLEKLSYPATKKEIASKIDLFNQEFREFREKTDRFDESKGMWESSLLEQGKVHLWHDTYSVLDTKV